MKALCWHGKNDIRCETVPDPKIEHHRDAIIKVTACAICGSDLHIYNGLIPNMESGDIVGHETMGEVVEVGRENKALKVGDRVVVPFTISCGECFFCKRGQYSACERSNPAREQASELWGNSPAGLFGYSHLLGGYSGGQAEYLRVPYADVGPIKVPDSLTDDQALFLSDIFPTGYMAAEFCAIEPGDTIAVWGCGPVGQFAIRSAFMLGAGRVVAIDAIPERLDLAEKAGAQTLNFRDHDVYENIRELTNGRGADACIDAVGTEADATASLDFDDRSGEGCHLPRNGSPSCAPSGDSLLSKLRHRFYRRRLWRLPRQDSDGLCNQSRPYISDGANSGATLPAGTTQAHRERRNRPVVRRYAFRIPRRWSRVVQDVQ
jgi:threonine dehydrogenase-like Zn-dependent dehydrogenase